jgi:hypothetical protein
VGSLLVAVVLAGCASGQAVRTGPAVNSGPLGGSGIRGLNCGWVHPGGVFGYGYETFQNSGASPAVIEKVALAAPIRLRVLAAYAVPVTGTTIYGLQMGEPPQDMPPGEHWPQRRRASGAVIPHSVGHDATNLILVLKPVGKAGSAMGVDVYYRVSDQQYQRRTAMQILLLTGRPCPTNLRPYIRR